MFPMTNEFIQQLLGAQMGQAGVPAAAEDEEKKRWQEEMDRAKADTSIVDPYVAELEKTMAGRATARDRNQYGMGPSNVPVGTSERNQAFQNQPGVVAGAVNELQSKYGRRLPANMHPNMDLNLDPRQRAMIALARENEKPKLRDEEGNLLPQPGESPQNYSDRVFNDKFGSDDPRGTAKGRKAMREEIASRPKKERRPPTPAEELQNAKLKKRRMEKRLADINFREMRRQKIQLEKKRAQEDARERSRRRGMDPKDSADLDFKERALEAELRDKEAGRKVKEYEIAAKSAESERTLGNQGLAALDAERAARPSEYDRQSWDKDPRNQERRRRFEQMADTPLPTPPGMLRPDSDESRVDPQYSGPEGRPVPPDAYIVNPPVESRADQERRQVRETYGVDDPSPPVVPNAPPPGVDPTAPPVEYTPAEQSFLGNLAKVIGQQDLDSAAELVDTMRSNILKKRMGKESAKEAQRILNDAGLFDLAKELDNVEQNTLGELTGSSGWNSVGELAKGTYSNASGGPKDIERAINWILEKMMGGDEPQPPARSKPGRPGIPYPASVGSSGSGGTGAMRMMF